MALTHHNDGGAQHGLANNGLSNSGVAHNGVSHNGVGRDGVVAHNGTTHNDKGVARTPKKDQTGLLTRWVPERFKHSALYRLLLRLTRVLQLVSAAVSLGIFSSRVYKVYRLVNSIKTRRGVNGAYGAVEGILAAAVLYTLLATLMQFLLKGGGPRWLRWLWVLLDLAFVGAFIAVSVLTSPHGGMAGPRHCYGNRHATDRNNVTGNTANRDDTCNLPWGTFILAIVSTVLHAITAAFHEVRDRVKEHHARRTEEQKYAEEDHIRHGGRMN